MRFKMDSWISEKERDFVLHIYVYKILSDC